MEKKATGAREFVASIEAEFRRFQAAGEAAMAQLSDNELLSAPDGSNSVAVIVRHLSGNFLSRFTDFLTTDGEKPWRDRDGEFDEKPIGREALLSAWARGWEVLLTTLGTLTDADLTREVRIRGVAFAVHEALHRALGHASSHVGQIVFLAKALRGDGWTCLTIPRGASATYNQNPALDRPTGHAAALTAQREKRTP